MVLLLSLILAYLLIGIWVIPALGVLVFDASQLNSGGEYLLVATCWPAFLVVLLVFGAVQISEKLQNWAEQKRREFRCKVCKEDGVPCDWYACRGCGRTR